MKDVYNDHQEDEHQLFKSFVLPVKRSMKKTLGNSMVCFNEHRVLLYETELVLHSRQAIVFIVIVFEEKQP